MKCIRYGVRSTYSVGARSLMFLGAMLAHDSLDTISNRTRRECVLCIDSVQGCRLAVQVVACDVS